MDTPTQATEGSAPWFHPLTGWEAASRWNAATFDWMARGFQQWLALVTTMPRSLAIPASPAAPATPASAATLAGSRTSASSEGHALARSEARRPARAKARPAVRKKAAKPRTRG